MTEHQKRISLSWDEVVDKLVLSQLELSILTIAQGNRGGANVVDTLNTLHQVKRFQTMVDKMIASNEKIAASNDRQATAMNWLTFGLLVVAAVQIYVTLSS